MAVVRLSRTGQRNVNDEQRVADPAEEAWIAAARVDPRAFAPLYDRYALGIYHFCYRKVGDVDHANDLTAQIFVKAMERIDRYQSRPNASFKSWLFTIARNTITDAWRRQRPTVEMDPIIDSLLDTNPGPERLAIEAEAQRTVNQLLAQLPDSQRTLVDLRLAGLSTKEIMATMNMSESAVKSAQHRAYRRLRELVSAAEGAEL